MLIQDLKTKKSHTVNLDILASEPNKLRVDVSTTLGMHVASLAMNASQVEYFVLRDRKFYRAEVGPHAFQGVLAVPLDPRVVLGFLLENPPKLKNFLCQYDQNQMLTSCLDRENKIKITWVKRESDKRVVSIQHPTTRLQLTLLKFNPDADVSEEKFLLPVPKGFSLM